MTTLTTAGRQLAGMSSDDEVVAATVPVHPVPGTYTELSRVVVEACQPGDQLEVNARARITNDCGYTIGVGYHLWLYDVDDGLAWPHGEWTRISPFNGDNVTKPRHHMPLHCTATYELPAAWPAGHRPVVVYRGDAHSTAWQDGDALTVDQDYGLLIVRRWA